MFSQQLAGATILHGAHPEEVSSFVNKHIGHHKLEMLEEQEQKSRLSFREFAGFGLSQISYGNRVRVKSPELESIYHLQVVTKGECVWRQAGEQMRISSGQGLMVNPYEKIDLEYSEDCEKLIIKVPEQALVNARDVSLGRLPDKGIRFNRAPIDLRLCPPLVKIIEAVFSEFDDAEDEDISAVGAPYRDIILKKLLKAFPSNWSCQDNAVVCSPSLEKMIRYIEENVQRNIGIEELSDVSNMSVRSIYNAFSKAYSTTPKCYIKQLKLQNLRADLLRGRCRNVTQIALDYGFSHLGRFSSDYRKSFGELPSETMRMAG
ncbi:MULTISPECIES: AraC family transcriptional regulator [unclassified Marinobacter]|uniref:AraC family transcriptional regulator n=1 Tax=unclassified Marinobacter TaxID=83889 RepID=UPI0026E149C5|nr:MULTISPECIES: AraC family transcriptional regulator [unclassified Marinobacter]MDO6443405.1 AraC family transcriptional regulator [Marinobacter sp. 2_MG-2023]MDO6824197.1 AraC family transcriptional regulator [Marinobacter sp. 1_MG-2023]